MSRRTKHLISALALCLFAVSLQHPARGEENAQGAIELGRQFKATPWLEHIGDVPFQVVDFNTIPILSGLPQQTPYYSVESDVAVSAYSYFFCVHGVDAVYIAGSVVNLAKLCHELAVLEEIKKRNKGKEFASGVGDSVKGIGTGFANLVVHPGLSMKSFGHRIRQTGRSIERSVGGAETVGRAEGGVDRSHLGSGPAGPQRRQLAFQLGVDVYTSNPVLQEALVELSQLRYAGGLTSWVIPFEIGVFSHMNIIYGDEKTELRIRDFDPYELRRLVGQDLEPVFNMNREDGTQPLHALLFNPNFTPREIAYIGLDFLHLGGAANLDIVLRNLAGAATPEEADMKALELRLYSFLHRRVEPLVSFAPFRNIFAAIGQSGKMYLMFPGDTLRPWDHTADAFGEILREAADLRSAGLEIWAIGDVDPQMVQNAAQNGVAVRQNILRDPQFFPAPEQPVSGGN